MASLIICECNANLAQTLMNVATLMTELFKLKHRFLLFMLIFGNLCFIAGTVGDRHMGVGVCAREAEGFQKAIRAYVQRLVKDANKASLFRRDTPLFQFV